jgi:hypothetical protein
MQENFFEGGGMILLELIHWFNMTLNSEMFIEKLQMLASTQVMNE